MNTNNFGQAGYTPFQTGEFKKPLRRYATIIGGGFLLIEIAMYGAMWLADAVFSAVDLSLLSLGMQDLITEMIEIFTYILGFWLPTAFMIGAIGIPTRAALPLRRPKMSILIPAIFVCMGTSMVGSTLSGILSVIINSLFDLTPTMADMAAPLGLPANILYVISMTVLPAIFEEAMFRGVILQSLRRFGDGFALFISALLFAMCHMNLVQGPNAFLMGLVIGYFVLRTGSLVTGMVLHFINNGLSVLFSYIMDWMSDPMVEILSVMVLFIYIVGGVISLIYLNVRQGGVFRLAPSDYPLRSGTKYTTFFSSVTVILTILLTVYITSFYFA